MNHWEKVGSIVPDTLLEACIGSPIAEGSRREAFQHCTDIGLVIKREKRMPPVENIVEWQIWRGLRQSSYSVHLGRLFAISESGRLLVMERLDSISLNDYAKTPDVPTWLADVKPDMFGKGQDGLLRVRDYGSLKLDVTNLVRRAWQAD